MKFNISMILYFLLKLKFASLIEKLWISLLTVLLILCWTNLKLVILENYGLQMFNIYLKFIYYICIINFIDFLSDSTCL